MKDLPLLATMGVGSYATPGWLFHFREGMRQGAAGPADVEETFEDAARIAIADQIEAGIDVICDGELRRMRFVFEMFDRLSGLERTPPVRQLGVPGYDRAPHFVARAAVSAPRGLGIVREYQQLKRLCPDRALKIAFPGPMSQWQPTLAAPEPSTWQVAENGGGYGHGQVTHSSALLLWLTGLRAAEVSARMTSPGSAVDMYDAASVRFENGAIGVVSGAATLPANDKFQVDLRVFGTEGVLMLDMERERMVVRRHDGKHHDAVIEPGTGTYDCVAPPHRFIEVIKGEARNDSPAELGARAVELISAMFESSRAGGGPVRVHRHERR